MGHERFNRKVWAFKHDFTGALAKWLVKQSPYVVPDNLSLCIEKFAKALDKEYEFDENGMVEIGLLNLTDKIDMILESIPEIMALNERKNGRDGMGFSSRYSKEPEPDDDFIAITAIARNITCEFADSADAQCWLDSNRL